MAKSKKSSLVKSADGNAASSGFFGILAFIGAAVYFVQLADGFGEVLFALLKAIVWPALLVYELLKSVGA